MAEKNREFLTVITKDKKTTYIYSVGKSVDDKNVKSVEFGESKKYKEITEGKTKIGISNGSNSKLYELVNKYIHWTDSIVWEQDKIKDGYTYVCGCNCVIRKYVDMHDGSRVVYKIYDFSGKLLFVSALSSQKLYDIFYDTDVTTTFANLYNQ